MSINVGKLHGELLAAGLDVVGVSADGRIDFGSEQGADAMVLAANIMRVHDPRDEEKAARETARAEIGREVFERLLAEVERARDIEELRGVVRQVVEVMMKQAVASGLAR
jgi:hypothetical protein